VIPEAKPVFQSRQNDLVDPAVLRFQPSGEVGRVEIAYLLEIRLRKRTCHVSVCTKLANEIHGFSNVKNEKGELAWNKAGDQRGYKLIALIPLLCLSFTNEKAIALRNFSVVDSGEDRFCERLFHFRQDFAHQSLNRRASLVQIRKHRGKQRSA